jgi:hypothetical protein
VWLAPEALPDGTPAEARRLETWLERVDADDELLDPTAIAALNRRNSDILGAWRDPLADVASVPTGPPGSPGERDEVDRELVERLDHIGGKLLTGEYVLGPAPGDERFPPPDALAQVRLRVENALPVDAVQAVVEPVDLRCIPLAGGLYRGRVDRWFDRNQCSRLHPGDLVRVLRRASDGWLYVRVGHGVGWLADPVLSPPMPLDAARSLLARPRLTVVGDFVPAETAHGERVFLRLGAGVPLVSDRGEDYHVLVPSAAGWSDAFVARSAAVHEGFLPFTRRNVLALAFARLGDPYGWGGLGGFRDCSSLLLDLAATFDLRLGRNSSVQAQAGVGLVDLSGLGEDDKIAAMRAADARGVVFVYMPGHIMLYLGELDGRPYALSAISEYLLPCPEGGHRTVRIDRVDVTDLERGRGTERTSFLERITTLAVFEP